MSSGERAPTKSSYCFGSSNALSTPQYQIELVDRSAVRSSWNFSDARQPSNPNTMNGTLIATATTTAVAAVAAAPGQSRARQSMRARRPGPSGSPTVPSLPYVSTYSTSGATNSPG